MSGQQLSDLHFSSLDLEPTLQAGLRDAGFTRCTPIQAGALPLALAGSDVAGQAQTGSGKTAAFLLSTMNHLLRHPPPDKHVDGQPRSIMLAPTRELAIQIHRDAEMLGKHTGLRTGLVYGGTGYDSQREMLKRGLDILVGTPGRLIDYFKQNVFGLKSVQIVVLDEADRMFDLGFIRDIRYLLRRMPPATERINMLFSATLSERVRELAYEHMNAPEVVDASPEQVTVETVTQTLYHVSKDEKIRLLVGLLRRSAMTRTIVFVNTKRVGEKIDAYLEANGLFAGLLSGDVPQNKRTRLLERFSRGEVPILVATDVAARGLHIPEVSHVINFDLPQDSEDYVHRIGRTARAGATGDAVSFACEEYVFSLEDIEDYIGAKIPTARVDDDLMPELKRPTRRPRPSPRSGSGRPRPGGGKGGEQRGQRGRSAQRGRG